jgi:2-polyprenyl-6-methoxyphenol hydroxylase-like FAD-dependent oxidoreductase
MTGLPHSTQVAVVGAGPTGLALAATLAAAGVDHVLIDHQQEGANTSRATVVHAATLEALDGLAVTERMIAEGLRAERFVVRTRRRRLLGTEFATLPSRYPFALLISQARTEALLLQRLRELGGDVHRPWSFEALRERTDGPGLVVTARDGDSRTAEIHAAYVVGADGMHSPVRTHSGVGYEGATNSETFVLADVRLRDSRVAPDEVALYFGKEGVVVVMPLPGGLCRVVGTAEDAAEDSMEPLAVSVSDIQHLADHRGPRGGLGRIEEIVWSSRFRVHHKLAQQYRAGRVLLAGDAAHVHSPAGGQGMNTGIQDAVELGTALAKVLGGADDSLLDEYAARRHEVAQQVVSAAGLMVRNAHLPAPLRPVRNTVMRLADRVPAVRAKMALRFSGLSYR